MWCTFLLFTLFVTVQGRAVNISNTWVLPEEGFPVFYRYFRDRISWYEADAVCQFHHANLVTVDTTPQYDAVRAYLKELDISSAVWVGLIRSNPDGDFTWTDYRGLSGDGYWSAAPDTRSAPLCAAADPASDYRWEARACGGPSVASFICELPVAQWALGNEGCMVRELPALTIVYLPESAAVQLTADCGLAGVKRVHCTGNMKREDLLKELSCAVEDQGTTISSNSASSGNTKESTDVTFTGIDSNSEPAPFDFVTSERYDELNKSISIESTPIFQNSIVYTPNRLISKNSIINKNLDIISEDKYNTPQILDNDNLHSNDIYRAYGSSEILSNDLKEKPLVEKVVENLQHKKLHDELARLGSLETIFSQTTDHFVPPLVMAKAKISNDMISLSVEEKLAQQIADHQFKTKVDVSNVSTEIVSELLNISKPTLDDRLIKPPSIGKNNTENSKYELKQTTLKKYNKYNGGKGNFMRKINTKYDKPIKSLMPTENITYITGTTEVVNTNLPMEHINNHTIDDTSIELSITLNEPEQISKEHLGETNSLDNKSDDQSSTENVGNIEHTTKSNVIMKDEVIKIVVFKETNQSLFTPIFFQITTKLPDLIHNETPISKNVGSKDLKSNNQSDFYNDNQQNYSTSYPLLDVTKTTISASTGSSIKKVPTTESTTVPGITELIGTGSKTTRKNVHLSNTSRARNDVVTNTTENEFSNISSDDNDTSLNKTEWFEGLNITNMETTPEFDDFQSPLLSGANEPLHKPNRSRRPQPSLNRVNKFNPFRILG